MLTVKTLQQQLDWQFIDEKVNTESGFVYLFIRPTQTQLEVSILLRRR